MFPEEFLTEGPCEMDVATFVFCYPTDNIEVFEKNFNAVHSNKWGPHRNRDYQFLMCCFGEERGMTEVQGMVQYEKEIHPLECEDTTHAAYVLTKVFGPYGARFFHQIEDTNVNNVYRWLKKRETGNGIQTFKTGVFVGFVDPEPLVPSVVVTVEPKVPRVVVTMDKFEPELPKVRSSNGLSPPTVSVSCYTKYSGLRRFWRTLAWGNPRVLNP